MKQPASLYLILSLSLLLHVQASTFEEIPEAGRIRIDGLLDDWEQAEWHPVHPSMDPPTGRLRDAEWSVAWSDRPALFIAVRYTLSDPLLHTNGNDPDAADHIELFVRGDTGSHPNDYAQTQESAQHLRLGVAPDHQSVWIRLGSFPALPRHLPVRAAVHVHENQFHWEIELAPTDHFDADNRRRMSLSELYPDKEIGLDLRIHEAGTMPSDKNQARRNDTSLIPIRVLTR